MRDNTKLNRTLTGGMALTLALTMALVAAPKRARADAPNFPSAGLLMTYSDNIGTAGNTGIIELLSEATDPKTGATLVEVLLGTFPPKGPGVYYVGSGIVQTFTATPTGQIIDWIEFTVTDMNGNTFAYGGVLYHDSSYSNVFPGSGGELQLPYLLGAIAGRQLFSWTVIKP